MNLFAKLWPTFRLTIQNSESFLTPLLEINLRHQTICRDELSQHEWDWARFETCAHKWVDLS
jgi:hypothetical protein